MNELDYFYDTFIKGNNKKLKNIEDDEAHNIIVHTFEVLKVFEDEKQEEIISKYEQISKTERTVWESYHLVLQKFDKSIKPN